MVTTGEKIKLSSVLPHGLKREIAFKMKVSATNINGLLDRWESNKAKAAKKIAVEIGIQRLEKQLDTLREFEKMLR